MGLVDDNVFPKLIESMNTTDPTAPVDSSWKIYAKAGGIYARSSNAVAGPFGAAGATYPPGYEFDYSALTANASITATSEGTANTVKASNSITYPGSVAVWVEFWAPYGEPPSGNSNLVFVALEDSTVIGLAIHSSESAIQRSPVFIRFRRTPSNAAHTYTIKAYVNSGTGTVGAGVGGSGAYLNGHIRVVAV